MITRILPTAPTSARSAALSSIWETILAQHQMFQAARQAAGSQTATIKLSNDLACNILKVGIPSQVLDEVGSVMGVNKAVIARQLGLDRGTLARLAAKGQQLPTHAGESVLRLLELEALAVDTFDTEDDAAAWLRRPHPMLEGETPLEASRTSFGAQRVQAILLAIKYGGAV